MKNRKILYHEKILDEILDFSGSLPYKKELQDMEGVNVNGYDENMEYGMEDYEFWLSLLEQGREVFQIPEVLFHYRRHNHHNKNPQVFALMPNQSRQAPFLPNYIRYMLYFYCQ
mgnify:CR=1 FL=1